MQRAFHLIDTNKITCLWCLCHILHADFIFNEHLSRRMLLRFVMYEQKRFTISLPLAVQLHSLWPVVLCGSQRIAFHHVSSWHKGGSRRPRTFLELRLQTVSLVGNLLTPVTPHVLFRYSELKKQENDTDGSNLFVFFISLVFFPTYFSCLHPPDPILLRRMQHHRSALKLHNYTHTCSQPFFFFF